jgi:hypothetical protein
MPMSIAPDLDEEFRGITLLNAIAAPAPVLLKVGVKPARISRAAATALAVALVAVIGWGRKKWGRVWEEEMGSRLHFPHSQ